jgi:hypothetical protein
MKRVLLCLLAVTATFIACADEEPELMNTPDSAVVTGDAALPPGPGAGTGGMEAGVPTPSTTGGGTTGGGSDASIFVPPNPPNTGGTVDAGPVVDSGPPASGDGGGTLPPTPSGGKEPRIPPKPAQCPEIKTGMITVLGQQVQLTVGPAGKKGPIVFYWHGTGSNAGEARGGLGNGFAEVQQQGGVIASFTTTTRMGMNTGNNVWYTGDFEMADQILACAVDQQLVDPKRVYTAGCSAGGLQASSMVYGRSSYLAAAMPNSGGSVFPGRFDDPMHVPAVIATHGAAGVDVVGVDFAQTTTRLMNDLKAKGGFAVQCDHGGRHCGSSAAVKNAQWQFVKDHYFGVTPLPYANGLPMGFPTFCKIIK